METLFVAWQQSSSREWIPVARLDRDQGSFRFAYTNGATRADGFRPFGRMDDLSKVYRSSDLFPLFSNRVLTRSRPEFADYFRWTGLPAASVEDPLSILAVTGGLRGTDPIEVFPLPIRTCDGKLHIDFFARGLRHLAKSNLDAIGELATGFRLYAMRDLQNENDRFALCLRTEAPVHLVGYIPKYYTADICNLLKLDRTNLQVIVKQVNVGAPLSMRLLCTVESDWPSDFQPFATNDDFQPLAR